MQKSRFHFIRNLCWIYSFHEQIFKKTFLINIYLEKLIENTVFLNKHIV